ncbi:hypothetical protein [Streptomyces sp. H27-D2]|uniref:hypothetical protein n=1 Tax=Streptomyces sp. H27-D2 TaxID=3046304 RepID=UPI002DC03315|nr:hypothetical protein [Streptomyces sp. H27-D2]MEC4016034.1 hypothetical protein [Streptomyces sp. H27-D2]
MTDQPATYSRIAWETHQRDAKCGCTAPDPADCAIPHQPIPWMCRCHRLSANPTDEELAAVQQADQAQPGQPDVLTAITRYEVSVLPADDLNRKFYTLLVERTRRGTWVVTDGHAGYLEDGHGTPGQATAHQFADYDDALALARRLAPDMTVNGRTATEAYRHTHQEDPMTSRQILDLASLMNEIYALSSTYTRAVVRAGRTLTGGEENLAAQARGNAALLEIERTVRRWVAEHPESAAEPPQPSAEHAAVYLDDDDELWADYPTSPPSDAVLPLRWASETCDSKQELADRGVTLRVIGWSR